jgi:hypothetical protein
MTTNQKILRIFVYLGIALLQLFMTQVVTFLASLLAPGMGDYPGTRPVLFMANLGITYSAGVFLVGWLALKLRWLKLEPKLLPRLVCTLLGAYLPLVLALFLYHPLEPGNPFFFISMLTAILGFYVPGWLL